MMQTDQTHEIKRSQEVSAVDRLLEVAEKRNIIEENWHHPVRKEHLRASNQSLPPSTHKTSKRQIPREQFRLKQNQIQKQRLQQLIRDDVNNQEEIDSPILKEEKHVQRNSEEFRMTMRFLKNAKLRPFNSNMTFYSVKKEDKRRYLNTSLAFHKNEAKQQHFDNFEAHNSFRVIKDSELEHQQLFIKREAQESKQLIYFKPNKSQTVRELLNHMKEERGKNRQIFLNGTDRGNRKSEQTVPQISIFNEYQLRMMNRYKKFIPFQKDENLLLRKMLDGENIWLKKYKQSWLRRKDEKQKKTYFKRLIVNN